MERVKKVAKDGYKEKYIIELEGQLTHYRELADKLIEKLEDNDKILKGFLQNPYDVATFAGLANKKYSEEDNVNIYTRGYEQALIDIKEALKIHYPTEAEIKETIETICNE